VIRSLSPDIAIELEVYWIFLDIAGHLVTCPRLLDISARCTELFVYRRSHPRERLRTQAALYANAMARSLSGPSIRASTTADCIFDPGSDQISSAEVLCSTVLGRTQEHVLFLAARVASESTVSLGFAIRSISMFDLATSHNGEGLFSVWMVASLPVELALLTTPLLMQWNEWNRRSTTHEKTEKTPVMDTETEERPIPAKHKAEFKSINSRIWQARSESTATAFSWSPGMWMKPWQTRWWRCTFTIRHFHIREKKFDTSQADIQQTEIVKPGASIVTSGFKQRNARDGPLEIVKTAGTTGNDKEEREQMGINDSS
jgi:hypothetical protein